LSLKYDLDFTPYLAAMHRLHLSTYIGVVDFFPSIRFTVQAAPADLPSGVSKLGGLPDLSPALDWPAWQGQPLAFLAQLNLGELQRFPAAGPLPREGLLSFFYHPEQITWGDNPADLGSWRVLYQADLSSLVRRDAPAGAPVYPACNLKFREALQAPELPAGEAKAAAAFGGMIWLELGEMVNPPEAKNDIAHRILGAPNPIQSENMELDCQLAFNGIPISDSDAYRTPRALELSQSAKDWRLLLQLDSERRAGMMWGDSGRLYFWIRQDDLAQANFAHVWMILQCC
jgi:uncharacterized protein YwqG